MAYKKTMQIELYAILNSPLSKETNGRSLRSASCICTAMTLNWMQKELSLCLRHLRSKEIYTPPIC